jgi:2-polyprenyl-3-methyl-5-hydroxy-6-metoxy-1,4-benzoquinol methylase
MDPRRESADVETSSDAYALRFSGPVGAWFLDVQAAITLALLAGWPGAKVLDVGGGHGQLTGPLVDAGYRVTVFGSDPACVHRVRRWVDSGKAAFRSGDLLALPFADRGFDAVVSYRLLPHIENVDGLVAELSRVAGRGVVVDYPTKRSVNAAADALFAAKKRVEGDTRPFRVFRDEEIDEAFIAAGLRKTARRPEFLFPMALHRGLGFRGFSRGLEVIASASTLTSVWGSPVIARYERG